MYIWRKREKEMYKIDPKQLTGLLSTLFLKKLSIFYKHACIHLLPSFSKYEEHNYDIYFRLGRKL